MQQHANAAEWAVRCLDRHECTPEAIPDASPDASSYASPRRGRRAALVRVVGFALAAAVAGPARRAFAGSPPTPAASQDDVLPRPASWQALLRESGTQGSLIVALFSTPGCGYCRLVRRDHLRHLARDAKRSGAIVVELSLADRAAFEADAFEASPSKSSPRSSLLESAQVGAPTQAAVGAPASPAALAASLGIRFAPTVAFFGPEGELAERLVGYASADFYGAYLDERIAVATAALQGAAA